MKDRPRYGHLIKWLFSIIDLIVLNSAFCITIFRGDIDATNLRLIWFLVNISYLVTIYFTNNIHNRRVLYADRVVLEACKSVALHAAIFISLVEFLGLYIPVKDIAYLYSIFTIGLSIWWIVSRKVLKAYRNHGFNYRNIIIIGDSEAMHRFVNEINNDLGYGYRIMCLMECATETFPDIPHKDINDIDSLIADTKIDEIYFAMHDTGNNELTRLLKFAEEHAIDFYYIPQLGPTITRNFSLQSFGNVPVMSVMPHPGQNPINKIIKRTFDIVVSSITLILSPLFFIPIAIAIKSDSKGPIIFKQKRTGYRGTEFTCYKFRTMYCNSNDARHQVTRQDPEVTRVGRFLRHYSLDELPQFFNVLKGEMSIVGPRPHMIEHTEQYRKLIDKYMLRHIIKPGITGWAQVLGYRGETQELWKMEKRVECDVWYAENWNLMLDLKIIILTIYKTIKGDKNAY